MSKLFANIFKNSAIGAILGALCLATMATSAYSKTQSYHFGLWMVKLDHNPFNYLNHCTLAGEDMTYQDGVISLHFMSNVDTRDAWYSLNRTPALPVSDYSRQVDVLLAFREPGPLDNPSGGLVQFPADVLKDAPYVDIKPNDKKPARRFKLDGLSPALAFMAEHGCEGPAFAQDRRRE